MKKVAKKVAKKNPKKTIRKGVGTVLKESLARDLKPLMVKCAKLRKTLDDMAIQADKGMEHFEAQERKLDTKLGTPRIHYERPDDPRYFTERRAEILQELSFLYSDLADDLDYDPRSSLYPDLRSVFNFDFESIDDFHARLEELELEEETTKGERLKTTKVRRSR